MAPKTKEANRRKNQSRGRKRIRTEFAELEAQIEQDFVNRAWHNFLRSINHGELTTESFQDQFKKLSSAKKAHARRDRYNAKRRAKKHMDANPSIHPLLEVYLRVGVIHLWDYGEADFNWSAMMAVNGGDRRNTRRLARECAVADALIFPTHKPWDWTYSLASVTTDLDRVVPKVDKAFAASLKPTSVPAPPVATGFSYPSEPPQSSDEQLSQDSTSAVASA
tara:strand:- start:159 stop:824 length:666 start_codon:yes stop_codon:yes gene_type:complete